MTCFAQIAALLGPAPYSHASAMHWEALERRLGLVLPLDFKELTDAYAPGALADFIDLLHPRGEITELGEFITDWIRFSRECVNEDIPYRVGTSVGEVLPIGGTLDADIIYFVLDSTDPDSWPIGVAARHEDPAWFEFRMTFTEWVYCILKGGAGMGFLPDYWPPDEIGFVPVIKTI